jgi:ADP-ribosylglycohydrolase
MVESNQNIDTIEDKAQGCMFGLFIGDSLGSYLEGFKTKLSSQQVETAMKMPGAGKSLGAPGQCTDDTEMCMTLMHALLECKGSYDLQVVTRWYGKYQAAPHMLNESTSLKAIRFFDEKDPDPVLARKFAAENNSNSNSALMRIAPLAIWCHKLSVEDLSEAVRTEVMFTHGIKMVSNVVITFCVAVKELLTVPATDPSRRQKSYEIAMNTAKKLECPETISYLELASKFATDQKITQSGEFKPSSHSSMFHTKVAFIFAFYFLLREDIPDEEIFDTCMREICIMGGDTDTNCAIAGAMVGAYLGYDKLPKEKVKAIVEMDPSKGIQGERPAFIVPND